MTTNETPRADPAAERLSPAPDGWWMNLSRMALNHRQNALRMDPGGPAAGGAALPGYSALSDSFTLNSVNSTPTFIFRGRDLAGTSWPEKSALVTLGVAGTGTAPASNPSPFPNPADTSVLFTTGGLALGI